MVLFDLGGVLCRFVPERRLAALAARCPRSPEEIHQRVWEHGFDSDCDRGSYSGEQIHAELTRSLALHVSYDELVDLWALAFEPDARVLTVVDDLAAAGVATALLTNNGPLLRDGFARLFPQLAQRFDRLLFSCDLRALKPERAIFDAALARLDVPASRVVLVDDSQANVDGARQAGIDGIQFTTVEGLRRALALRLGLPALVRDKPATA